MSVRDHRVVAASILAVGVVAVACWGRSVARESGEVRSTRERFRGTWVATSIEAGEHRKAEGAPAASCSATFDGKSATLRGLVGGIDASGTYYIEERRPGWVDFKLDAGWIIGLYRLEGDTLTLCLNPFAPPERLGVPTLPRPREFRTDERRHVYTFRRAGGPPPPG